MKLFLSYAAQDRKFAERLVQLLRVSSPEIQVILPEDLTIGKSFTEELRRLLVASDAVVLILSSQSSQSAWVLSELGAALASQKIILPVVIGVPQAALPDVLRSAQYLTFEQIEENPENLVRFLTERKEAAAASQ
jgi:hypothetical protein